MGEHKEPLWSDERISVVVRRRYFDITPDDCLRLLHEMRDTYEAERNAADRYSAGGLADKSDVNHPPHYNTVPGIECIDVVQHFSFVRGSAIKYLWRAGEKGDVLEDLRKAAWYIEFEIRQIEQERGETP